MSLEQLHAFALEIARNAELATACASNQAADADDQAEIARKTGFDVHPADLVNYKNGSLVEYVDEDFFMKPSWWTLVEPPAGPIEETVDFDGDGIVDAIRVGEKWVLPADDS